MAAPMAIRVTGLRNLQREAASINKDLGKELRKANKSAAEIVAEQARREAPRRSGRLAKSIGVVATQRGASVKVGTAARVPYAAPIHFGWFDRNIKANEFLYRAMAKTSKKAAEVYEKKIGELAERIRTRRR